MRKGLLVSSSFKNTITRIITQFFESVVEFNFLVWVLLIFFLSLFSCPRKTDVKIFNVGKKYPID